MPSPSPFWLPGLCSLILASTACSSTESDAQARTGGAAADAEPSGTLVVFAAASLTDVFQKLEGDFESAYPKVDIKLNFAGSQSLRTQIQNGARAQVFASANAEHIAALRDQGLVEEPVNFANNKLVIVVPSDNPAGIESLEDLANAERLVVAGDNVPAGVYTTRVLKSASASYGEGYAKAVADAVVSRETHVRQVLQKVVLGEADAAVVYATDAVSAGDKVKTIAIPDEHNVVATYPIVTLSEAKRAYLGKLFISYLSSETGAKRLTEAGFTPDAMAGRE